MTRFRWLTLNELNELKSLLSNAIASQPESTALEQMLWEIEKEIGYRRPEYVCLVGPY